jgi:hypothetical protein
MRSLRSLLAPLGRSLAPHLDRLRYTLDALGGRLRAAVAHAVGEAVAGAVRETLHELLAGETPGPDPPPRHDPRALGRPRPVWEQEEDDAYLREEGLDPPPGGWWSDEPGEEEPWADERPESGPRSDASALAVTAGCRAAAWWLRRQAGRVSALAALGVGAVAGVAAYVAGASLAGAALSLVGLTETVFAAGRTLASFGST